MCRAASPLEHARHIQLQREWADIGAAWRRHGIRAGAQVEGLRRLARKRRHAAQESVVIIVLARIAIERLRSGRPRNRNRRARIQAPVTGSLLRNRGPCRGRARLSHHLPKVDARREYRARMRRRKWREDALAGFLAAKAADAVIELEL